MFPSRLLIVEYLCAGFAGLQEVSRSMLREGRAMLLAMLEDAGRIDGLHVTTLWNSQLGPPPATEIAVLPTSLPYTAQQAWRRALNETDAVYVIAPETDDILSALCEEAAAAGTRVLNCAPDAIDASGDKWDTFLRMLAAGIPTIETQLLEDFRRIQGVEASAAGWVIKPRYGCGSEGIRVITDADDARAIADTPEMIIQPYLPGQPASVAALFDDHGRPGDIFPGALQRLTSDLRYASGCIPAMPPYCDVTPHQEQISEVLHKLPGILPGLRGYAGIDLLIQRDGGCIVVEVNPRLTTSYIGYRRLTVMNLAERWLSPWPVPARPIEWLDGSVSFSADGAVIHS